MSRIRVGSSVSQSPPSIFPNDTVPSSSSPPSLLGPRSFLTRRGLRCWDRIYRYVSSVPQLRFQSREERTKGTRLSRTYRVLTSSVLACHLGTRRESFGLGTASTVEVRIERFSQPSRKLRRSRLEHRGGLQVGKAKRTARPRKLTSSSLLLSQVLVDSLDWRDPRSRMIPTGTLSHCLSFQFTREDETKDPSRTSADRAFSFSPLVPEGQHRIETQGNQLHAWAPTRQFGSVPRFVLLQPSSPRSSSLEEIDSNLPSTKMRAERSPLLWMSPQASHLHPSSTNRPPSSHLNLSLPSQRSAIVPSTRTTLLLLDSPLDGGRDER